MARKISTPLIISLSAFLLSAGFACAQCENGGAGSPQQVAFISALPTESLTIAQDETRKLEVPFEIEQCQSSTKNIRILANRGRFVEIQGIEPGYADLTLTANAVSKTFKVRVTNSLASLYRDLCKDISDFSEVTAEMSHNAITLRGEISKYSRYVAFKNILDKYSDSYRNYVSYKPGPEMFDSLKKQLSDAGFKVENGIPKESGIVGMKISSGILAFYGKMLCDNDISDIKKIVSSQKWLSAGPNPTEVVYNLEVDDTQLDVNVVIVGVTRSQLERMGNSSANGTVLSVDLQGWFKTLAGELPPSLGGEAPKSSGVGGLAYMNTGITGAIQFFGANGVSDFRDGGHLTLTSNSKGVSEAVYENGGTLNVEIHGRDVADLKEINFGLTIKVSGGLVKSDKVRLILEVEKSLAPIKQDDDYLQRKTKSKTEIVCNLNQTAILAGQRELTRTKSDSGYAFLRHVPILDSLFGYDEENVEELQLLILVSPQISKSGVEMASKPSSETANVEDEVSNSLEAQSSKLRENSKKSKGEKMFTW